MDTDDKVNEGLRTIKEQMPDTYKSILAKAASIGTPAFGLVRRSLRGEANCFWAAERGHVVGTPFEESDITRDVASLMVQFGASSICMWGKAAVEAAHGAD